MLLLESALLVDKNKKTTKEKTTKRKKEDKEAEVKIQSSIGMLHNNKMFLLYNCYLHSAIIYI